MLKNDDILLHLEPVQNSNWDEFLEMLFEMWFEQDKMNDFKNGNSNSTSTEEGKNT